MPLRWLAQLSAQAIQCQDAPGEKLVRQLTHRAARICQGSREAGDRMRQNLSRCSRTMDSCTAPGATHAEAFFTIAPQ